LREISRQKPPATLRLGQFEYYARAVAVSTLLAVFAAASGSVAEPTGRDPAPAQDDVARLDALVIAIRTADYRSDRAELRRLDAALEEVTEARLAVYRRYWQGFARWRRALNGFNETPTPPDLTSDLEAAAQRFRAALAERPDWIEARIGIAGSLANLLFLSRHDQTRTRAILAEYVPTIRDVAGGGAENPRALWLMGGAQLGAPPPHGGDAAKAAATFQRGLESARREAQEDAHRPPHVPSWGAAENLMSLAYLHSHSALEDSALALAYARGALAVVPDWHYVANVLIPQIETLGSRSPSQAGSLGSVALRVHRLPAMVAFYSGAFGVSFREVEARGTRSQFGTLGGIELKLVPIRESVEFERFPIHQLGFQVPDVGAAVAAALEHGGRLQDAPATDGERVTASVRDPDGNTVEIRGPR
jgi:catechol 2,3-dioxygenase-like lactoylglutathione lyase family enzyme